MPRKTFFNYFFSVVPVVAWLLVVIMILMATTESVDQIVFGRQEMSHFENGKIIKWPTRDSKNWPGWEEIDCGCCNGIQWGGEEPRECEDCGASGVRYRHKKSGVYALYPGGPFR